MKSINFNKIFILFSTFLLSSCVVSDYEELSDQWFKYSNGLLVNKITQIMLQKDTEGNFIYKKYPTYIWEENTSFSTTTGKLIYKEYGRGDANKYSSDGRNQYEDGQWTVQWAPATNENPLNNDVIFTIKKPIKFSDEFGQGNMLWTPYNEFCETYFNSKDADILIEFGDSLRNAYIKDTGLSIREDGRFTISGFFVIQKEFTDKLKSYIPHLIAILIVLNFYYFIWLYKCPKCGKRSRNIIERGPKSSSWRFARKSGGRDKRYGDNYQTSQQRVTFECKYCSHKFHDVHMTF